MAVKAHKEVQLFKRVLTHDKFGDHVEEVRFEGPICLTGVKVGAAPGSAAQTGGSAHVSVFARDLSTLASARFACLTEQCSLPASGTKAVRLEPVFTDQVVLRGRYQTLPVALYGWTQQDTPQLQHLLPVTTLPSLTAIANAASSGQPFKAPQLPGAATGPPYAAIPAQAANAVNAMLPYWTKVRESQRRMRKDPPPPELVKALLLAADTVCAAAVDPAAEKRAAAQQVLEVSQENADDWGELGKLVKMEGAGKAAGVPVSQLAADMAAEWSGIMGAGPAGPAPVECGMAGLAAAVIVCASPRHARRFMSVNGAAALAEVLTLPRPPAAVVRYAISALELLTRSCGAAACELVLGWWTPPPPADLSAELAALTAKAEAAAAKQAQRAQQQNGHSTPRPQQGEQQVKMERSDAAVGHVNGALESGGAVRGLDEHFEPQQSPHQQQRATDQDQHMDERYSHEHEHEPAGEGEGAEEDIYGDHYGNGDADAADIYGGGWGGEGHEHDGDELMPDQQGSYDAHEGEGYEQGGGEGEDVYGQFDEAEAHAGDANPQAEGADQGDPAQIVADQPQHEGQHAQQQAGNGRADQQGLPQPAETGNAAEQAGEGDKPQDSQPQAGPSQTPAGEGGPGGPASAPASAVLAHRPSGISTEFAGPEEEVDYGDDDAEGHAAGHRGQPGWDEPDSAKPQDPERLEDMLADTPERLSDDDTKAKEQVAGMADAQAGADASKPSKSERERRRKDKSDSKHDSSRHPDERKGKDKDKKRDKEKSKDKDRDKDRERKRKDRDRDREKDRDSESRPRKSRRSHSKDRHASRADDEDGQRRKRARSRDRPTSRPSSRRSSREPEPLAHSSQAPSSSRDRSRGGQAGASAEPGGADALRSPRAGDRAVPLEPAVQSPSGRSASARAGPESSPAPLRGRDGPDKEAGRSENGPRAARERDKKLGRYDEYEGCYQALVDLMLERLPSQVTALGVKLLSRLRIYELAARFQAAADQLVQGHASEPRMATRDATLLCAQAGSALADLGDELAAQAEPRVERAKIVAACESSGGGVSLRPAGEPDGWALEALAGRRCLALLAAALHVPALHAAHLENSGALPPQTSAAAVQATLSQPLFSGVKALLSLLLSSSGGLSLISHEAAAAVCIISALDPNAAWYPDDVETNPDTSRAGPGAEMALTLQASLRALKAVERLPSFAAASLPALALLTQGEAGRHAVVAALCHQPGTLQWLVERLEAPIKPKPERGAADVPAAWHPDCMFAARLLLEVVRDPHPAILPRWLPSAEALKAAAAAALDKSEAQQAGGEVTKQELRELQARADSGASLAARGINALLQLLASLLPPSVASADPGQRRIREVDAKAAIQMFSATDKAGGVESGLDLLHALLVEPAGTFRAFAVLDADGLQVLERAVLTGLAGASASDADGLWAAFGGVALDDESLARNRARALRLLYSAASALSVLLQHMRCQDAEHSNAGCMRALLRAHACLCSTPESLAGMVGSVQGSDTRVVLQARQALAAGLKCWVESDLWAPDLIPTIFSGGKAASGEAASTVAQAPNEIFTSLCLLGDLFPGEWPPAGSARRGQHPPPSHMRYRAALARSFEPSAARFRRMISAAAASDSRIFRAALVRLCARAAGLGGGMGVFLAGPLIEQLKEAIATSAALAEVRRILEILVPLVYRPALKAAFLDLKLAGISARLLSRLVPVLNEGADAVALCTMVMELVTVLFNPDVCLNPALPPIERVLQECPPTAEAGLLVAVLLASLQRMGGNAHIAKRVLRQLANHAPGRAALRLGTAKWQVQAGAANPGADPNSHESMTWAADRLSELANSEAESEMDGMRAIMTEVAAVITEVSAQSQADEYDEPEEPPGAPARFAAAVQAAVSAGIAAGLNPTADTSRSELAESSSAAALVYDTATRVFWRNVKARSTTTTVPPLGRNPTRWEVSESVDPGTVASHIGEGLTEAKRSRDATLQAVAPGAASSQSVKQEKPPVKAKEEPAAAKPAFAADIPGADLPPVIAPPGRPRGRPAMLRGGPSAKSRPASMHVDDYQKLDPGPSAAAAPPASAARPQPGLPGPPSSGAKPFGQPQPPMHRAGQPPRPLQSQGSQQMSPHGLQAQQQPGPMSPSRAQSVQSMGTARGSQQELRQPPPGSLSRGNSCLQGQASGLAAQQQQLRQQQMQQQQMQQQQQAASGSGGGGGGMDNMMQMLQNPAGVAALLKDPVKLQKLLEQNPALLQSLKSRLGK